MDPKKSRRLFNKYPRIFKQRTLPIAKSSMSWGLCCGDGWFGLIDRLCQKIEEVYAQLPKEYKSEFFLTASQVKQKGGGLRFYLDTQHGFLPQLPQLEHLHLVIAEAEMESLRTCERCGASGSRDGDQILCREHRSPD